MNTISVLAVDLDDTLYEELSYLKSGFMVVAAYMEMEYQLPKEEVYRACLRGLTLERERVFDRLLKGYNLFSEKRIRACLSVFRFHTPDIALYEDAKRFLQRFASLPIYLVTDGNTIVQKHKFDALSLEQFVKKAFFTRRYGLRHEKPSPYCFAKILQLENVIPSEVLYIGDNPNKDFVGIKPLGFRTARLLRGPFAKIRLGTEYDAEVEIENFDELVDKFHYEQ